MAEGTQQFAGVRQLTAADDETVTRFLQNLPEEDLTFFKEDINPETVARWSAQERGSRWATIGDGEIQGMVSLIPGVLWSSHVGELRLVVAAPYRRLGIGRRLARLGLAEGVRLGLGKIVVEVVADKEGDIEMFASIGFTAEALLKNHIRDQDGRLRDLVVLAHDVADVSGSLGALGLESDLPAAGHG